MESSLVTSTFNHLGGIPRIVALGNELLGGILTRRSSGAQDEPNKEKEEEEVLVFFTTQGYQNDVQMIGAREILAKANKGKSGTENAFPSILGIISEDSFVGDSNVRKNGEGKEKGDRFFIVAGWTYRDDDDVGATTTFWREMALVPMVIQKKKHNDDNDDVDTYVIQLENQGKALNHHGDKDALLSSSIKMQRGGGKICAKRVNNLQAVVDEEMVCYSPFKQTEDHVSMAQVDDSTFIHCKTMTVTPTSIHMDEDMIQSMHLLQCTDFFVTFLVSTRDGVTKLYEMKRGNEPALLWEQEEGLSDASSAIFLDKDAVAMIIDGEEDEKNKGKFQDEEEEFLQSLTFSSRMTSQWKAISSFVMGGFVQHIRDLVSKSDDSNHAGSSPKSDIFGLNKVAVILSNNFHKVIALDTSSKGSIVWKLNLNSNAVWHKVIHGTATSRSSALGQGKHHPHSPEILVLSYSTGQIEWKCVDGLRGHILAQSTLDITSDIVQIVPIHGHSHGNNGCKQGAGLILSDGSVVFLPGAQNVENNLFTHVISKDTGILRSMKVHVSDDGKGSVDVVGETVFDPKMERIINVAYPQRNEVIQSPFTILGDDSLVLKYLNPHLCVIITEATVQHMEELEMNSNELLEALNSLDVEKSKTKKKPVGVTPSSEESVKVPKQASIIPTLFVNVVDTVSGQVLHRTSHSHASLGAVSTAPSNVPVVISENWIIYAFVNQKSRRTEIGVLTLHEGMIDKHGITAFSTPEQQLTFSSFTSQKPIVLAKTYAVNYPVSAIGVTNTKAGISSKNLLLATGVDGRIVKIDRRLLDPRRPFGEPKTTEKMEGLLQYSPLLPLSPLYVESYSNNIESASILISTAANLESQTLIMALGGPDIFFTRLAPSNGFDLLPDSFNKLLILMVMIGLYMVLRTLKNTSEKKFVTLFWS